MRRKIQWAALVVALVAAPAVAGLVLLRDDGRRAAALTQPGVGGGYQLEIAGLPPSGNAMVIESYSWGGKAQYTIGATGLAVSGKPDFHALDLTKKVDSASPLLFKAVAAGTGFAEAKLTLYRGAESPQPYMVYTMTNVIVSSIQHGGEADNVPKETISLAYEQLEVKVMDVSDSGKADGETLYHYNLAGSKQ